MPNSINKSFPLAPLPVNKNLPIYFWNPVVGIQVQFLAFITAFDDNVTTNWKESDVYGRQDAIQTFQNTKRQITCSIGVPSWDEASAVENYYSIKLLQQMQYPLYKSVNGEMIISSPPLIGVLLPSFIEENPLDQNVDGRYLFGTLQLNVKQNIDKGLAYFGIDEQNTEAEAVIQKYSSFGIPAGRVVPREYAIDFTFKPIHKRPLGWEKTPNGVRNRTAGASPQEVLKYLSGKVKNLVNK